MEIAALLVKSTAGIVGFVCFVLMLVHFFQSGESGLAIVCIVASLFCGIGSLIAYVKGWMDGGMETVMWIWTIAWGVGLATHFVLG